MIPTTSKLYAAILFSDLEKSARIAPDDDRILKLEKIYERITNNILTSDNHFYSGTDGDAFKIFSFSCANLAEIALRMRDEIRSTNWKALNLLGRPAIRIALHFQQVQLLYDKNKHSTKLNKVVGSGLIKAARIEPIVESNQVFCTEPFLYHLLNEKNVTKANHVGLKELAKNFGPLNLYQLFWESENTKEAVNSLKLIKSDPPTFLTTKSKSIYLDISNAVSDIQFYCQSLTLNDTAQLDFSQLMNRLNILLQSLAHHFSSDNPIKMAIELHIERIKVISQRLTSNIAEIYPGLEDHKFQKLFRQIQDDCEELILAADNLESVFEKEF